MICLALPSRSSARASADTDQSTRSEASAPVLELTRFREHLVTSDLGLHSVDLSRTCRRPEPLDE